MKSEMTVRIIGCILLVIGIVMRYTISRRKFNRRSSAGLQGFSSYEKAWTTRLFEKFGKLIAIASLAIGLGLLLLSFA